MSKEWINFIDPPPPPPPLSEHEVRNPPYVNISTITNTDCISKVG